MDERDYKAMSEEKKVNLHGWQPIDQLNHRNLVWLTDGFDVWIGNKTEPDADGDWCWATVQYAFDLEINYRLRQIVGDTYTADINPTFFHELPIIPLI